MSLYIEHDVSGGGTTMRIAVGGSNVYGHGASTTGECIVNKAITSGTTISNIGPISLQNPITFVVIWVTSMIFL